MGGWTCCSCPPTSLLVLLGPSLLTQVSCEQKAPWGQGDDDNIIEQAHIYFRSLFTVKQTHPSWVWYWWCKDNCSPTLPNSSVSKRSLEDEFERLPKTKPRLLFVLDDWEHSSTIITLFSLSFLWAFIPSYLCGLFYSVQDSTIIDENSSGCM